MCNSCELLERRFTDIEEFLEFTNGKTYRLEKAIGSPAISYKPESYGFYKGEPFRISRSRTPNDGYDYSINGLVSPYPSHYITLKNTYASGNKLIIDPLNAEIIINWHFGFVLQEE